MAINFITPPEMLQQIAAKARAKRLALNLSQQTLSKKSGVSYSVLKKFEQTGKISLLSLLKLAIILNALGDFENIFIPKQSIAATSLDALIRESKIQPRKRGRK